MALKNPPDVIPETAGSDSSGTRPREGSVEPIFFEAVLSPHRSLPPRGFFLLMLVLGSVSFACGVSCVLLGAWPIFGFFGLDVLLVYIAFKINYRGARQREWLLLTEEKLVVERTSIRGEQQTWQFQPSWLRLVLEETEDERNRLVVMSHGRSLVLGGFLSPPERRLLAAALTDALARRKCHINPALV